MPRCAEFALIVNRNRDGIVEMDLNILFLLAKTKMR